MERSMSVQFRQLGAAGPRVSAIGLGCIGMSVFYGPAGRQESIATIYAALDAGITLLDTGDFYGMGHNELPRRSKAPSATMWPSASSSARCVILSSQSQRPRWCRSAGRC
jgi:hypothetical protein